MASCFPQNCIQRSKQNYIHYLLVWHMANMSEQQKLFVSNSVNDCLLSYFLLSLCQCQCVSWERTSWCKVSEYSLYTATAVAEFSILSCIQLMSRVILTLKYLKVWTLSILARTEWQLPGCHHFRSAIGLNYILCLLYTSDAADE